MQHSEIAQSSKHANTFTGDTVTPWVFFAKSSGCESSKIFYTLAMSQVSHKERTEITMVTKNWTFKVGLSRFPNNTQEAFLLTNGEIF